MYTDPHTLYRLATIHHHELIDAAQRTHSAKAGRAALITKSERRWTPTAWILPLARRRNGQPAAENA